MTERFVIMCIEIDRAAERMERVCGGAFGLETSMCVGVGEFSITHSLYGRM